MGRPTLVVLLAVLVVLMLGGLGVQDIAREHAATGKLLSNLAAMMLFAITCVLAITAQALDAMKERDRLRACYADDPRA